MLKTFRKYRKSVLGVIGIGCIIMAMSGFGISMFNPKRESPAAIRVNDEAISFDEFHQAQRSLEDRYRRMFGKDYQKLLTTLKINPRQQTIDRLIDESVLAQEAKKIGLYVGDQTVQAILDQEVFKGNYDPAEYNRLLSELGMTAPQFEESIRQDALRSQLTRLVSDAAFASKRESRLAAERRLTKYDIDFVQAAAADYLKDTAAPSDAEIESFYNQHVDEFKEAAKVSYEYAVLDPSQYENSVEISNDDIELYYNEHQPEFVTPEQVRARRILIAVPPKTDETKKAESQKKADELAKKIKEGASFEQLAKENSDDKATADKGGELGWIEKGKYSKAFDEAVFRLMEGESSAAVETPNGFEIIQAEEIRPAVQQTLEQVRTAVITAIRKREAPSYLSSKAAELLGGWQISGKPLAELAKDNGLSVSTTQGLLVRNSDPRQDLTGLTSKVMESPEERQQLADLPDKSVLVQVNEYKASDTAPLAAVKEKIADTLKAKTAEKKAKEALENLLAELKTASDPSLRSLAAKKGFQTEKVSDVSSDKSPSAPKLPAAVFFTTKELEKPEQVFESAPGQYLTAQVVKITSPSAEEVSKELLKAQQEQSRELSILFLKSLVERLKASAKIDVDSQILSDRR